LPGILDIVRQRYPQIRISITTSSSKGIVQKLEQRELDIVFAIKPEPTPNLRIVDICTFGMFWISRSNQFPGGAEDMLSRDDLLGCNLISYESGSYNYQQIINYFTEERLKDATVHYSNSLTTTINMISAGVGISVIPPVVIQKELRSYSAIYLESAATRLITLVANIAREAGRNFSGNFSDSLAYQD